MPENKNRNIERETQKEGIGREREGQREGQVPGREPPRREGEIPGKTVPGKPGEEDIRGGDVRR